MREPLVNFGTQPLRELGANDRVLIYVDKSDDPWVRHEDGDGS